MNTHDSYIHDIKISMILLPIKTIEILDQNHILLSTVALQVKNFTTYRTDNYSAPGKLGKKLLNTQIPSNL
jgi:hypothetical protein